MSERTLVSKSEYARMKGVSPPAVTYWARDGRIVVVDGKVDVEASDALLAKTGHPSHGGKRTDSAEVIELPAGGSRERLLQSQSRRADTRAQLDELDLLERKGLLVERARYDEALADGLAPVMSQFETLSARLGPKLVGLTDLRRIQDLIDDEVAKLREETATTLRAMIAGADIVRQ